MSGTYLVECRLCQREFDAVKASWCRCLATEPTLVCPSCLTCFCDAPEYRREFWAGAPQSVWDAKRSESREVLGLPPNLPPAEAKRPLVLFVDDHTASHAVVVRAAFNCGCGVVRAEDGRVGLQLAKRYRPDLVLSDALMPHLDGREMCKQIKRDPSCAKVKTVILTGVFTGDRHAAEARRAFLVDDYLRKPVSFRQLQTLIAKHLRDIRTPTDPRRFPRYAVAMPVRLRRLEPREGEARLETTFTQVLGRGGARVATSLPVQKDELVVVEHIDGGFRTRAAVQNVTLDSEGNPRAHLWFLDELLPEELIPSNAELLD
jgi:CheY-like chemotaxis protein